MRQVDPHSCEAHVRHIRSLLWADREVGRAAVMVGAGFSLNAEPSRTTARPPMLWGELAAALEAKVRGVRPEELKPNRPRSSPLRIASEFQHVFGRNTLDEFLRDSLDDASHLPGELHRILLTLPWSDVFTTNYDRLLERASSLVVDRKYDVVLGTGDIPGSMKPRIVKLHGSFSSHRPFIITEEDYRTYPQRFAPFVNMVQQSIMENAFCLLGFSGDDPNFLEWVGWVRDNLGAGTPPLYLVGVLDLSEWQREVLVKRGVTPVDLGPLFPEAEWPERASRLRGALLWFLRSLQNGVPADPNDWPAELASPSNSSTPGVLPAPIVADVTRRAPLHVATAREMSPEHLEQIRSSWEEDRRRYPGWLTCPAECRKRLWRDTEYVLGWGLQSVAKLPPTQMLMFLHELTWRLSRLEAPAYEPIPGLISDALRRVNPFPAMIELVGAESPQASKGESSWDRLAECWRGVAEFALTWARRDANVRAFDEYSGWLERIAPTSPHLRAFVSWQRSLRLLGEFNVSALEAEMERWIPTPELPVWEMRRGALLAELGDMREAQATLARALQEIRSRLGGGADDRELLSHEGWCMAILRAVSMQLDVEPVDHRTYTRRWARLERLGASPWDDVESLRERLRNSPGRQASVEVRKEFDPGAYTISSHFGSGDPNLSAFQALGVLERSGAPLRAGSDATFGGLAHVAALQAVEWSPEWALSAIVRSDSVDKSEAVLSRPRIMALEAGAAARLIQHAFDGLQQSLPRLDGDQSARVRPTLARRLVDNLSELLSRLTLRMSAVDRSRALQLACDGLALPGVRKDWGLWKPLGHLLSRTLQAMDDEEVASALPMVLGLGIPGERGFEVPAGPAQTWPEPLDGIALRKGLSSGTYSRIQELVEYVRGGEEELRMRAARRLAWLEEAGLLGPHKEDFGRALWAVTDPTSRLPKSTPFLRSAFLGLPAPPDVDPKSLLRAYVLAVPFPPMSEVMSLPDGTKVTAIGTRNPAGEHFREIVSMSSVLRRGAPTRIAWTAQEAEALLDKAHAWWTVEASRVRPAKTPRVAPESAEQVLSSFVEMVGFAVTPHLEPKSMPRAWALLDALDQSGVPTLAARSAFRGRDDAAALVERIRVALRLDGAKDAAVVEDALQAVAVLLASAHGCAAPDDLLDDVLLRILSGRRQAMHLALGVATAVVNHGSRRWSGGQRKLLESVLQVLLEDTNPEPGEVEGVRAGLSHLERPECRRLGAELAATLFAVEGEKGMAPSAALVAWQSVGESDPLPEVRAAWRIVSKTFPGGNGAATGASQGEGEAGACPVGEANPRTAAVQKA